MEKGIISARVPMQLKTDLSNYCKAAGVVGIFGGIGIHKLIN